MTGLVGNDSAGRRCRRLTFASFLRGDARRRLRNDRLRHADCVKGNPSLKLTVASYVGVQLHHSRVHQVAGNLAGWRRINGLPFRLLHVLAIVWIALQAWLGQICPLTTLEDWLRREAGATGYAGSFVQHWLTRLLFYDAPAWVFIAGYSAFALVVVLLWWRFPPRRLS